IARRIRPGYVIAFGLAVAAVGFVIISRVSSAGGIGTPICGFAIVCIGVAVLSALGADLIVGSAPPEKAGGAASISETSGELGVALGLATLGSIGAAVYRGHLSIPNGIDSGAAASAHEGISGAVVAIHNSPGPLGVELLGSAREAFANGLSVVAVVCAVAMAVLAVATLMSLRRVPIGGRPQRTDRAARDVEADRRRFRRRAKASAW
ncbi:MAG: hypothetical protein ACREB0_13910, partial [Sphingopyxis sp.]